MQGSSTSPRGSAPDSCGSPPSRAQQDKAIEVLRVLGESVIEHITALAFDDDELVAIKFLTASRDETLTAFAFNTICDEKLESGIPIRYLATTGPTQPANWPTTSSEPPTRT